MSNYIKEHKQIKIQKIHKLQNLYKFSFFCLHNNLTAPQIFELKKQNIVFCVFKQKLLKNIYNLKGKGSVLIIFFNDFSELRTINSTIKKIKTIKPIFLLNDNKIVSILKIQKLLNNFVHLSTQLRAQIYRFNQILLNIH